MADIKRIAEIDLEITKLQQERKNLIDVQKKEVINNIKELVKTYGLSSSDLSLSNAKQKSAAVARYKNPTTDETWTGKGRKPFWLEALLNAGTKLESLEIK